MSCCQKLHSLFEQAPYFLTIDYRKMKELATMCRLHGKHQVLVAAARTWISLPQHQVCTL